MASRSGWPGCHRRNRAGCCPGDRVQRCSWGRDGRTPGAVWAKPRRTLGTSVSTVNPKYIRTNPDETKVDNLLELPDCA
ncbi:DUF3892 domain-containing protein [Pyxidicoccus fallax]|uniref:DUF3892 domain-containing protein n=1 Tax=Pyxidicoccus fallax TaxID=394095 RepID=A0A848LDI4_9BACT|nr:DUF3892 domain-containing protein [Pyxidicoccus fallax]NPC77824.1 DUF3892 domain-containing protein [Pyxidicoccus fallax]